MWTQKQFIIFYLIIWALELQETVFVLYIFCIKMFAGKNAMSFIFFSYQQISVSACDIIFGGLWFENEWFLSAISTILSLCCK